YDPIVDSLSSVGTLAVLLVGAWRLRDGAIGVSELVSAAFVFALLDIPVRAIGWLLTSLPFAVAGWDRVQQVLTATGRMEYGKTALAPSGDAQAGGVPAQLRLDRVELAHEPGRPVLREVSFTLPAGRVLALVGPTGSGKSTIASLAARLLDPTAGAVTLDGVDLRQLTAASLTSAVALVPQVPFVFDDTVRANVALDRAGIDDERVWAALRAAQADGFVARLPDGLDSVLGERGVILSGGQRQRITLARALAGQPRLLVLDDATSAVDPRVEAAILASLRAGGAPGSAPHSILVIAYRRATIALADEVVYLEQGRVVATGSHAELLASVPGYVELVTAYEKAEAERVRTHAYDSEAEPAGAAVTGAAP
ncbi:MAG TPA: ABC transporter ATP-binding protein, partial [Micromonosporaceae bacterium]|nr:ABC transporter ATP-binding protein [Micromonosporaceae bacterium]